MVPHPHDALRVYTEHTERAFELLRQADEIFRCDDLPLPESCDAVSRKLNAAFEENRKALALYQELQDSIQLVALELSPSTGVKLLASVS